MDGDWFFSLFRGQQDNGEIGDMFPRICGQLRDLGKSRLCQCNMDTDRGLLAYYFYSWFLAQSLALYLIRRVSVRLKGILLLFSSLLHISDFIIFI